MKLNQVVSSLSFVLQITLPGYSAAQTLQLMSTAVSPTLTHRFYSGSSTDTQGFTFPSPALYLNSYDTIQFTASAPAGYAWLLTPPSHGPSLQDIPKLGFSIVYVNPGQALGAPYASIRSATLGFNFIQGGPALLSDPSSFDLIPESGHNFQLGSSYSVNGNLAFTEITMTVSFDNSSLAASTLDPFLYANLGFERGDLPSDPGPRLALIPVPEPGILSLGIFGFSICFSRKRCVRLCTLACLSCTTAALKR